MHNRRYTDAKTKQTMVLNVAQMFWARGFEVVVCFPSHERPDDLWDVYVEGSSYASRIHTTKTLLQMESDPEEKDKRKAEIVTIEREEQARLLSVHSPTAPTTLAATTTVIPTTTTSTSKVSETSLLPRD